MQRVEDKKIEQMISHMMLDMGVPAHLKGYRYVRTAVLMAEEDMKVVGSVTKLLYPEIAKQYNTTDGKVERAIRNAIEISCREAIRRLLKDCSVTALKADREDPPTANT